MLEIIRLGGIGRGATSEERRGRGGRGERSYYENNYDEKYYDNFEDETDFIEPSLEDLLLTPKIKDENIGKKEDKEKENDLTLIEFKKKNINKLYEDMVYYFSSPEILKKYKSNIDEEKYYDFYKDLDSVIFTIEQKERIKTILALPIISLDAIIKTRKLLNYKNILSIQTDGIKINEERRKLSTENNNSLREKLEEYSNLCLNEKDEYTILFYLSELKNEFENNILDIESLGLVYFNYIENYLVLILNLIMKKLEQNKNKKNINTFILICSNILNYFKSSKLFFFLIKYSKDNIDILENLELKDNLVQLIPNNMINYEKIGENKNIKLICNLNDDILKNKNKKSINYWTLTHDNYLLIFYVYADYFEHPKDIYYNYLKIHLIDRKIVYKGKIDSDEKSYINVIDINITLKNGIIYFLIIGEKYAKYYFKYILLNKYNLTIIKNGEIELINQYFEPFLLLNDNKYFYCLSKINNLMLVMNKNYKLDNMKYVQYNLASRVKNYFSFFTYFKNYNSLSFNNLFVVNNTSNKKNYFIKLLKYKDGNYLLNFHEIGPISYEIGESTKIAYNENRCIISEIDDSNNLYVSICSHNNNFLNDKGILLLPFSSYQSINYSNNIYEHLLQEYSSYLNIFGNFDSLCKDKEYTLLNNTFSMCCNFDENNLDFIIKNITENSKCDNIKLYYIIILKQLICTLYNTNKFNEKKIKEIIPFFKILIINNIKEKGNKIFTKILKEIAIISSYLKSNIIEINDIKYIFDENNESIKNKIIFLLIELLLEQKKTQKQKELFQNIINLEKNF